MSDEIRPAIHAMWWKEIIPRIAAGDGWVPLLSDYAGVKNSEGHAAAALALYGQPFGFTKADVEALRIQAQICRSQSGSWRGGSHPDIGTTGAQRLAIAEQFDGSAEWYDNLANRIAALLPP